MLTDLILIHQLQLPDLSDRQKAEIIAEFLSAVIHLNVHCGEDFQTLIAEEMTKLSDEDEEDEGDAGDRTSGKMPSVNSQKG